MCSEMVIAITIFWLKMQREVLFVGEESFESDSACCFLLIKKCRKNEK